MMGSSCGTERAKDQKATTQKISESSLGQTISLGRICALLTNFVTKGVEFGMLVVIVIGRHLYYNKFLAKGIELMLSI